MRKVENLFKIQPRVQGSLSASSEPLNSPLILGRQRIIETLKDLGISEYIRDFREDALGKIIARQAENLPTDENGKSVLIVFNSDRDNSTAPGVNILTPALSKNMSLAGFEAKQKNQFVK